MRKGLSLPFTSVLQGQYPSNSAQLHVWLSSINDKGNTVSFIIDQTQSDIKISTSCYDQYYVRSYASDLTVPVNRKYMLTTIIMSILYCFQGIKTPVGEKLQVSRLKPTNFLRMSVTNFLYKIWSKELLGNSMTQTVRQQIWLFPYSPQVCMHLISPTSGPSSVSSITMQPVDHCQQFSRAVIN